MCVWGGGNRQRTSSFKVTETGHYETACISFLIVFRRSLLKLILSYYNFPARRTQKKRNFLGCMIDLVPLLVCWGVHFIILVIMENLTFKLKTNMGKNYLNDDAITLRQFVPKTSQVNASNYV
jgi:hypothetical protein